MKPPPSVVMNEYSAEDPLTFFDTVGSIVSGTEDDEAPPAEPTTQLGGSDHPSPLVERRAARPNLQTRGSPLLGRSGRSGWDASSAAAELDNPSGRLRGKGGRRALRRRDNAQGLLSVFRAASRAAGGDDSDDDDSAGRAKGASFAELLGSPAALGVWRAFCDADPETQRKMLRPRPTTDELASSGSDSSGCSQPTVAARWAALGRDSRAVLRSLKGSGLTVLTELEHELLAAARSPPPGGLKVWDQPDRFDRYLIHMLSKFHGLVSESRAPNGSGVNRPVTVAVLQPDGTVPTLAPQLLSDFLAARRPAAPRSLATHAVADNALQAAVANIPPTIVTH